MKSSIKFKNCISDIVFFSKSFGGFFNFLVSCSKHIFYFLVILLSMFSVTNIFAEEKLRVAVIPFESIGTSEVEATIITTLFESSLVKTRIYDIIEQEQLTRILQAQAFSLSGCSDDSCAIEVGELLSAEMIVIGKLSRLGKNYIISAKLIDVTLGKSIYSDFIEVKNLEKITGSSINKLVLAIVGQKEEDNIKNNDLWFKQNDKNIYWQHQLGGGGIYQTGISWFFLENLSLDVIGGVSYYSYSDITAETIDGFLGILSSNVTFYWFDYYITPYLQAGLTGVTDLNKYIFTLKSAVGVELNNVYMGVGLFIPLFESKYDNITQWLKIEMGIKF